MTASTPKDGAAGDAPARPLPGLRELVGQASLVSVDLVGLKAERNHEGQIGDPLVLPENLALTFESTARHPIAPCVNAASFLVETRLVWTSGSRSEAGEAARPVAEIRLSHRLSYHFAGRTEPVAVELLAAFAEDVAAHHVWPFLRERIRSLSVELGMPPVLLPLRHLPARLEASTGPAPAVEEA